VGELVSGWSEEGASAAELVVSELVANAMLHARTVVRVQADVRSDRMELHVVDGDGRLPTVKAYGDNAPTGRGLRLVSGLSEEWGAERRPGGKAVWAVLRDSAWPDRSALRPASPAAEGDEPPAAVAAGTVDVRLRGVPLELLAEGTAHYDELLRELAFVGGSRHFSARLDELARAVQEHAGPTGLRVRSEIEDAGAAGAPTVDLRLLLAPGAWAALRDLLALLDEADDFCERMELLTLASSPGLRRLRRWSVAEISRQMAGAPARPWDGPRAGEGDGGQAPAASRES
jgi:hypothetical protein